jgi:hypothetical protein
LLRNAQKRDKKQIEQNNLRRKKRKNGGKKSRIFCDEPRWIFSELPLLQNAQKTPFLKKSIKNKNKHKNKIE